jgi:outer membrane lipoprotein-sorting protein
MKKLLTLLCLCCTPLMFVGCSEQTQQEASEAAQQTGEALESATKDVVEGAEDLTDKASDAINDDEAAEPADSAPGDP